MEPASQISRLPMASNSPTRLPSLGLARSNSTRYSKLPTANSSSSSSVTSSIPTPSKLAAPSSYHHSHNYNQSQNAHNVEGSSFESSNHPRHSLSASASVSHSPSRIPGFSNAGKKVSIADRARLFEKLDGSASAPNASPTRLSLSGADSPRRADSPQKSLMPRPVAARRRSGSFSDSLDDTPTKPSRGRPISIAGPFISGVPVPKFTDSADKDRHMMPPPSKLGISRSRSPGEQENEGEDAVAVPTVAPEDEIAVEEDMIEGKDYTISGIDGEESPGEACAANGGGAIESDTKESEEPPEPDDDPPIPSSSTAEKPQKSVQIKEPPLPTSKPAKQPIGKVAAVGLHTKQKSVSSIASKPATGANAGLARSASTRKPSAKPPVPKFGQSTTASAAPAAKTTADGVVASSRARPRSMIVDPSKLKAVSGSAGAATSAKEAPARMASSTISVAKKNASQPPSKLGATRSISLAAPRTKSISDEKVTSKPKHAATASTTRAKVDTTTAASTAAAAATAIQRPSSVASNRSDSGSKRGSRPPSAMDAPAKASGLQQSLKLQKPFAAAVAKASKEPAPPSPTKNRAASPTKNSRPQFNNFKKEYPKAEKPAAPSAPTASSAPQVAVLPLHVFHAQVRLLQLSELHAASFKSTKSLHRSAEAKLKEKFDAVKQKNSKITARERAIQESLNARALGLVFDSSSSSLSTGGITQEGRGHRKSLLANADEAIQNFSETAARMSALFAETPGPGEYTLLVSRFTNWLDLPQTPTEHADGLGPEFHHELTRVRRKLDTGLRVLEGWESLLKSSGDEDIEKKSSLGKMISGLLALVRGGLEELGHIVALEASTVAEARKELREKVDGILKEQLTQEEEIKPIWS